MSTDKYVILRSPKVRVFEFGPVSMTRAGSAATMDRTLEGALAVETATLDKSEIRELRRDPDVVSFAPIMPLKLHEPVERDIPSRSGLNVGD